MPDNEPPRRTVSLVRYEDDHATLLPGRFIPRSVALRESRALMHRPRRVLMIVAKVMAVLLLVVLSGGLVLQSGLLQQVHLSAALADQKTLLFKDPHSELLSPARFGPLPALAEQEEYEAMRATLITGYVSFVDIDLVHQRLRYFDKGVLELEFDIQSAPPLKSWCHVSAGLYEVTEMRATHTSDYLDVILPSTIAFGANRLVHGWPHIETGEAVSEDFSRDCVRLNEEDAKTLFEQVRPAMPLLVHAAPPSTEAFAYESRVPEFSTPYYLIADLKSDTVLAVGDKDTPVPIASLTKLMTALVVLESLPLDKQLSVHEANLVVSLVPRLKERSRVSAYTLLELLLVESSNEAAEVLASALGRERFIALMNERAAEIGLVDTVFTDPSGLDDGNVSSVRDLWWLTRHIYLKHPFILALTENKKTPPASIRDSFAELNNFNTVDEDGTFFAGKIGETTAAKQTSITLHRVDIDGSERELVLVLLGSEARNQDVATLLRYVDERFSP